MSFYIHSCRLQLGDGFNVKYLFAEIKFCLTKTDSMYSNWKSSLLVFTLVAVTTGACQKHLPIIDKLHDDLHGHLKQTKTHSAEVVVKWLDQQLNMFRLPLAEGATAPAADRVFAYSGIALYEAVVPGMPAYRSLEGQLTEFPNMPKTEPGKAYHWAASANAALAAINRSLFANASAANKQLMDQLENNLQAKYAQETDEETLERSIAFGREVAQLVWAWAQTDGTSQMPPGSSYQIPTGPGLWEKTPPAFGNPVNAFHHMRRQLVPGSRDGAAPPPLPFAFSTDPGSEYFKMAKEVYDISQSLTDEQRNTAMYHREGSGYGGGSSIAGQLAAVITKSNARLDKAALALVKVGIGSYEGLTFTFIEKYKYNVLRPITYIQKYMGHTNWATLYGTPAYPEYPAGHPTNGGVLAVMLSDVFGSNFNFEVDYYNYLGLPLRSYASFEELAQEMAIARVYSGIHFKPAVNEGVKVGRKVASNILRNIRFHK
jgi:hypothetical protein